MNRTNWTYPAPLCSRAELAFLEWSCRRDRIDGVGEAVVRPLLATQILWINLINDSAPALAMGVDPEIEDVTSRD